jgi:hypothetical protein
MKTVSFIVLGLLPALALRYGILRKPISRGATAGACFGILIFVAILVSTNAEEKARQSDEVILGPLPILTDLISQMFYAGTPVLVGSYFILRRGANSADEEE